MDTRKGPVLDISVVGPEENTGNVAQVESLNESVGEFFIKVDQLEQKLNEVEQFYSNLNAKQLNAPKGREKFLGGFKRGQHDAACREAASAKRMQVLMHKFGTILSQITQDKWAGPFMQPVDVEGLKLHDYYDIIKKPMDFSTIKSKMEAKDGSGYKNVREICSDMRLIFKNAMKYNEEGHGVHNMAKNLLDKFETKWLKLLPEVDEEEKRRQEEEAEMQLDIQLAQEASHAKKAKDLCFEVDTHLENLKEMVLQKCRKMSTEEKKRLGSAITRLSPEDINKALEIVAQIDPNFQAAGETVEVDIDAQSESTLWELKFFVKDTLQAQMKENNTNNNGDNNKRKREICDDSLPKTSHKRGKK